MHDALVALLNHDPVGLDGWRSFWDQLSDGGLERGETAALLASLSTQLPDHDTLSGLLQSLDERRTAVAVPFPGTVNIVGTGGGPRSFNISTASAFVAAACGVRVVKTGSRAYTSKCGSIDLLERLGVPLTKSYEHTDELLDRHGVAFAGFFVYPNELMLLAKSILPLGMKPFGRFLNALGPFLALLPRAAQLTGVSDPTLLPSLRRLAATMPERNFWICANSLGADELLSFAENVVYPNDGHPGITLSPGRLGFVPGDLDDVRPAGDLDQVVDHFLAVVSGEAGTVPTQTVCLNAAAMAMASGHSTNWVAAIAAARDAVETGAVRDLVDRMRAPQPRRTLLTKAAT